MEFPVYTHCNSLLLSTTISYKANNGSDEALLYLLQ
ncbi:hypothetical protein CLV25_10292 [Acetobacteroides hydrogenigenes]|uniref:Uncharacterized protein n=1 Tax=Acetobacteroides hydrogenigenes TaxID=979970 RepID=A0A4R2F4R2_9BACT|nr:hypothetical protein CLV25_10292 [Acetobacteroides hydrogenigenes]